MLNFIIKTHQKDTVYKGNQIFILNKGINSGKPQKEPFTNSFVIMFPDEKDAETVYWLSYSLWLSNFWHPFLIESVIPFLRITDFKKNFDYKVNEMMQDYELHLKQVQALRLLLEKEDQLKQKSFLINEMRRAILYSYYKK
jgi:hypothetical protein